MFGRLNREAFAHDPIEIGVGLSVLLIGLSLVSFLFYTKRWKWLWSEWLTSLDPKKIGKMYLLVALAMLFKGLTDAGMMRAQQILSVGDSHGYLSSSHFQQIFTAHGTTMIFFVGMGVIFGLMNLVVPLQIGARDVAFPFLNSVSFWLFSVGAILLVLSLMVGKFAATGWVAYPPLSGIQYSPGVGVDYWIWSVQIAGIGSLLSGINFFVTITQMRCPGMTLMKVPIFVWTILCTTTLILFAFPVLTANLLMLSLDRLIGSHFFTPGQGGNPMLYINLIWAWGHPEVYILILPAFGVFSEVVATFSKKRLFGYVSMVYATIAITVLSFIVWLHHFFTMGAGASVNAFFGIMTMLIAVPTGVKIFNWLFTLYQGRVDLKTPLYWFLGFVFVFTTGGMAGVLMSLAPIDFQVHNSLFLIAHFHSMVIGGVLFAFFSAVTYWFPKYFGYRLNETLGKWAFFCWLFGFFLAFLPLYILGFMGATRRLDHYEKATGWQPFFLVAAIGVCLIFVGVGFQLFQMLYSYKKRKETMDTTGDPWDGRTLEWSVSSPPPEYHFAKIPEVDCRDPFWESKERGKDLSPARFEPIALPSKSPYGVLIGGASFLVGFGLIWHLFWLALLGVAALFIFLCLRLSERKEAAE